MNDIVFLVILLAMVASLLLTLKVMLIKFAARVFVVDDSGTAGIAGTPCCADRAA